jgi:hypothetical protein
VVDVPSPRVRADDERRHAQAVAGAVDDWRGDVVVEASPVVPCEEDRGRAPVGALHDGVDDARDVGLPAADERRRMLADLVRRRDPRDGRKRARPRRPHERAERPDVAQLVILGDRLEPRKGIPDARSARVLRNRLAEHRPLAAIRLPSTLDVVAPAHVVRVEEVREVGPVVVRNRVRRVLRLAGRGAGVLDRRTAAHRLSGPRAPRRPRRHEVEVGRQAPGRIRLEHVVLQDEVPGVGPVVRDLTGVVVPDDVRRRAPRPERAGGCVRVEAAVAEDAPHRLDEAVHPAVVDVEDREAMAVRAAVVAVARVVERAVAPLRERVRDADGGDAVPHRDPVRARIRAEVRVERPVLLHDHDHVPDLVDAGRRRPGMRRLARGRGGRRGTDAVVELRGLRLRFRSDDRQQRCRCDRAEHDDAQAPHRLLVLPVVDNWMTTSIPERPLHRDPPCGRFSPIRRIGRSEDAARSSRPCPGRGRAGRVASLLPEEDARSSAGPTANPPP